MQQIIVDTSSIVFALSNGRNVFTAVRGHGYGYSPVISKGVINELRGIKGRAGRYGKFAASALMLLDVEKVEVSADTGKVDLWIMHEAESRRCAVCTNDIRLKRALKARKIRVFSVTRAGLLR